MKKTLLLLFTALISLSAMGNNEIIKGQNESKRGPFETNRWYDNIFIGAAGGVNLYFGETDNDGKFRNRIAPALDINVGKWFTPSVGLRLGYYGLEARGWTNDPENLYIKKQVGSRYEQNFGTLFIHGDVIWNISNTIGGYKPTRVWDFVPFLSAGWARSYGKDTYKNELAVGVGLLNNIRLCNLLDLTLEARHVFVNQRFDYEIDQHSHEGMTSVTVGLTFKLNRNYFTKASKVNPTDLSSYKNKINDLEERNTELARNNQQLNAKNEALNSENNALKNQKPTVANQPTTEGPNVVASPVALFFAFEQATLDSKELVNLEFYVKNAIKADKNKVFTLIGSADKGNGSSEYNQKLSEDRMEYVYNLLLNKYGIPADRLIKKAEGDTNNRFNEPKLNRVVIIE